MADGAIVAIPRKDQTADKNIESLEGDRGDGVRLIQTIANLCIPGATVATSSATADTTVGGVELAAANEKRVQVVLLNNGSNTVYIGTGTVTTSAGFPLPAGGFFTDSASPVQWKGITASGSSDVRVLEVSIP